MNPHSAEAALRLETVGDRIALVTFDMPGSRANTLGSAVLAEWVTLVNQLARQTDLRGLVLRSGKPGMFIAGADLKELGSALKDPEQSRTLVRRGLGVIAHIEALPYPTVALIDGACMGGGLELALGFDFRLAGTNPKTDIGLVEVKIGLIPGWGGTQRLTRVIGPALAAELICAGETANAVRARQLGIVTDVVPSEKLLDEALRLIEWAHESRSWQEARRRKQQPVGLSAGTVRLHDGRGPRRGNGEDQGPVTCTAGRSGCDCQGLQSAAGRRAQGRERCVRAAGRQPDLAQPDRCFLHDSALAERPRCERSDRASQSRCSGSAWSGPASWVRASPAPTSAAASPSRCWTVLPRPWKKASPRLPR